MRAGHGQALKDMFDHFCCDIADPLTPETQIDMGKGTPGKIDNGPCQRLIEWDVGISEAAYAPLVAQGLVESGTERKRAVLCRVVVVDVEIAFGTERYVDAAVARQRIEKMVEKAQARGNVALAGPVEVDGGRHVGFPCRAGYGCHAFLHGCFMPRCCRWG